MGSIGDPDAPLPDIDWAAQGIETELGWALPVTYRAFSRLATGAVADVPGGPRGYQVLVAITTEEPTSQLALGHRLGIDKTQMTTVVDALESGGFAERRPDSRDRRVRQVHPTAAGRTLLDTARERLRGAEGVLLRHLEGDEQTQLRRLLARVALGAGEAEAAADGPPTAPPLPVAAPQRSRRSSRSATTTNSDAS
ncbi:MarR family winged helix-turn-helix transcriptional regulator [Patulibacter sp. SYSU D01012]|uniref:MarR family winged helix-turn-helix transcriptional regulator n=1 Tax=Patulibacter sp. SYSU D01012 TaxID=2817381 RepID=UPI001B3109F9|nr:MarR family winged helix-turn-helix transcriptional regulator [Patulibacter sp. SYSU D01012]